MHFAYIFVLESGTKTAMDKPTKKLNNYNQDVIERLKSKYGVSKRFVTMSLSGDRHSETSTTIKKDYKLMTKAVKELLKTL